MLVRVVDLQSFDATLDLPDNLTVADLREMIESQFHYDLSHSTLFHGGLELPLTLSLTPSTFSGSNVIAIFNSRIFPQKSYPKVDQAFRFFPSRFQEYHFAANLAEEFDSDRAPSESRRHAVDPFRLDFPLGSPLTRFAGRFLDRPDGEEAGVFGAPVFPEMAAEVDDLAGEEPFDERDFDGFDLTPVDLEAIRRLEELGMDRATVIEVYFACNGNESQAENILMSLGQ
jgi:hypothetical protein